MFSGQLILDYIQRNAPVSTARLLREFSTAGWSQMNDELIDLEDTGLIEENNQGLWIAKNG